MVAVSGFEPPILKVWASCSASELRGELRPLRDVLNIIHHIVWCEGIQRAYRELV
jgi:hypothetical protein